MGGKPAQIGATATYEWTLKQHSVQQASIWQKWQQAKSHLNHQGYTLSMLTKTFLAQVNTLQSPESTLNGHWTDGELIGLPMTLILSQR